MTWTRRHGAGLWGRSPKRVKNTCRALASTDVTSNLHLPCRLSRGTPWATRPTRASAMSAGRSARIGTVAEAGGTHPALTFQRHDVAGRERLGATERGNQSRRHEHGWHKRRDDGRRQAGTRQADRATRRSKPRARSRRPVDVPSARPSGAAHEIKGNVKKAAGDLLDSPTLKAEGEADKVRGKVERA